MTDTIPLNQLIFSFGVILTFAYRFQCCRAPPENWQSRIPTPIEKRRRHEVVPAEGKLYLFLYGVKMH